MNMPILLQIIQALLIDYQGIHYLIINIARPGNSPELLHQFPTVAGNKGCNCWY
jgi:hypothetical protein